MLEKQSVPLLNSLQLNRFPVDSTFKCKSLKHKMLDRNIGGSFHNPKMGKTKYDNKPET